MPVRGTLITRFNAQLEHGARSKGIRVRTQPEAQVASPWDGKIVFSGQFRDYGQLLIISHGDSYHSLLAGLGVIEVDIAQWVLAGEPVGLMGHNSASRLDAGKPSLYIELRRKGQSIDPMPWIAVAQRKAR